MATATATHLAGLYNIARVAVGLADDVSAHQSLTLGNVTSASGICCDCHFSAIRAHGMLEEALAHVASFVTASQASKPSGSNTSSSKSSKRKLHKKHKKSKDRSKSCPVLSTVCS